MYGNVKNKEMKKSSTYSIFSLQAKEKEQMMVYGMARSGMEVSGKLLC